MSIFVYPKSNQYLPTSYYVLRKMMIGSLSEDRGIDIAKSPLSLTDRSGWTAYYANLLDQQINLILFTGPQLWENIQ